MLLNMCKEERKMSRIWANKNAYRVLVGNRNEKQWHGRSRNTEKNDIEVHVKGNTMETVDGLIWLRSDTSGGLY
jgi:hypothetical protein